MWPGGDSLGDGSPRPVTFTSHHHITKKESSP